MSNIGQVKDAKSLGEAVKAERKRQQLTQEELAQYAGVGANFISQLERGKPTAELEKTFHVLSALGLAVFAGGRNEWRKISMSTELGETRPLL